jgi:Flp pilus assembly pilin Flp
MNKVRDSLLSLFILPGFLPCTAVPRLQVKTQMDHEQFHHTLWSNQRGQDIAEYAVILAVILVLVVGTIRLVGSNANNAFSSVASSIQ